MASCPGGHYKAGQTAQGVAAASGPGGCTVKRGCEQPGGSQWQAAPGDDVAPLLASDTELTPELATQLLGAPLIAIDFPKFTDGRGYSLARLLRERYGYQGQIRAVGDVLIDQLYYMSRCGFDAFWLREDQIVEDALNALDTFSLSYQPGTDTPEPLFRRRMRESA